MLGVAITPGGIETPIVLLFIKAIFAAPIAWYAKRKSYSYWTFFIAGVLLELLTCLAIVIALPKVVRKVGEDEIEVADSE
ncbi:MAG: hypothetical protein HFJ72_03515 [Adlercreutzia sp.]|nr:hypothetical protein [Adlercreutzia sp.]